MLLRHNLNVKGLKIVFFQERIARIAGSGPFFPFFSHGPCRRENCECFGDQPRTQ